jgi:hypothetical protein
MSNCKYDNFVPGPARRIGLEQVQYGNACVRIDAFFGRFPLLSLENGFDEDANMDFQERREQALRLLEQAGIGRSTYAPPVMRLLWRFGVQVRPPHFMGFGAAALLCGAWFAVAWGAIMWIGFWSRHHIAPQQMLASACMAGLFFGLCMAGVYAYQRKKHSLPSWDSLA